MVALFSIIIPVYKVDKYIRECLESVIHQSFSDWEVICIDDGSPDTSPEICEEYARNDNRIKVFHQKNQGVGAARNAGLSFATGQWIIFLDGDDFLSTKILDIAAKIIAKNPNEKLVRFNYKSFEDGDSVHFEGTDSSKEDTINISQEISHCDYTACFWQYVYKKEIIEGLSFPKYTRGEDSVFIISLFCKGTISIVTTDAIGLYYRQRKGSAIHTTPTIQSLCDVMDSRLDIIEILEKSGKTVEHFGNNWIDERYFVRIFPIIISENHNDFCELKNLWRIRLERAKKLKSSSLSAKIFIFLHTSRFFRIFAEFYTFKIQTPLFISLINKGNIRKLYCKIRKLITKSNS